jgi:predicted RNA binding protein YcfA (HicA-like mRNA interferase family)
LKLRPVPPLKVIKVLERIGFQILRKKGSHVFLKHPDGRTTVVPVHSGEEIGRGLLRKIIKDAKLTRDEFLELVENI